MMRILIFGTGNVAQKVMQEKDEILKYVKLIGFIDNDDTKYSQTFYGSPVYSPTQVTDLLYDGICILLERAFRDVYMQLVYGYHVKPEKILNQEGLVQCLMAEKYKDADDKCIQDTLKYWEGHSISYFNQYQYADVTYDRILWDKDCNMPYTVYRGKKLYYPRAFDRFILRDGCIYAATYRDMEQAEQSPHRYLARGIQIKEGDVVVDAGAREGDFALPYIDMISRLILFESDPEWVNALQATYRDYADKVSIIPKMLGNCVSDTMTTLDEIIGEDRVDFLKMDIEGWECDALSSARGVLERNHVRCAICSYHRKGDSEKLRDIFRQYGYRTDCSNGYMVFLADDHIFRNLDFRKAVIYADKDV